MSRGACSWYFRDSWLHRMGLGLPGRRWAFLPGSGGLIPQPKFSWVLWGGHLPLERAGAAAAMPAQGSCLSLLWQRSCWAGPVPRNWLHFSQRKQKSGVRGTLGHYGSTGSISCFQHTTFVIIKYSDCSVNLSLKHHFLNGIKTLGFTSPQYFGPIGYFQHGFPGITTAILWVSVPGSASLIPSPGGCKDDAGQSCLLRSGVCTMNSHSPRAPLDEFWQMDVTLGPSSLGRPAAFPPAPSSPHAPLQLVIPLPWEPVTYFCHSMFAHSRILHAACHLLVPGFFHAVSVLLLSFTTW